MISSFVLVFGLFLREKMKKCSTDSTVNNSEESGTLPSNDLPEERLLKGVMRVGDLAKQLMLRGDLRVDLVVLCSEKPTLTLLKKVHELLPDQFQVKH